MFTDNEIKYGIVFHLSAVEQFALSPESDGLDIEAEGSTEQVRLYLDQTQVARLRGWLNAVFPSAAQAEQAAEVETLKAAVLKFSDKLTEVQRERDDLRQFKTAATETIARVAGILRGYYKISTGREEETMLECAVGQLEAAAPDATGLIARLHAAEDARDELKAQIEIARAADTEPLRRRYWRALGEVEQMRQQIAAKDEALIDSFYTIIKLLSAFSVVDWNDPELRRKIGRGVMASSYGATLSALTAALKAGAEQPKEEQANA